MARKQWKDLNARTRGLIVGAGVIDALAKIAALLDLLQRPPEQICGSKRVWAISIVLVNSVGALPAAYFLVGRRAPGCRRTCPTSSSPSPEEATSQRP